MGMPNGPGRPGFATQATLALTRPTAGDGPGAGHASLRLATPRSFAALRQIHGSAGAEAVDSRLRRRLQALEAWSCLAVNPARCSARNLAEVKAEHRAWSSAKPAAGRCAAGAPMSSPALPAKPPMSPPRRGSSPHTAGSPPPSREPKGWSLGSHRPPPSPSGQPSHGRGLGVRLHPGTGGGDASPSITSTCHRDHRPTEGGVA